MTPALWGALTALCWGSADFIARFSGRAIGPRIALFGMLLSSAIIFSILILVMNVPFVWALDGLGHLLVTGIGAMVATLFLYWGLARGPVTVVAPIAASYPVINIAYALFHGAVLLLPQWLAMVAVMVGVIIVARCVGHFEDGDTYKAHDLRKTVLIALAAAISFSITVISLQEAGRIYGEIQTVFLSRWIALAAILVVLAWQREKPVVPRAWWPLIGLQGLLDGLAFLGLTLGGQGAGGEIAAVVASTFSAVTIILARLFLKEAMSLPQWLGIGLIIVGVVVLTMP